MKRQLDKKGMNGEQREFQRKTKRQQTISKNGKEYRNLNPEIKNHCRKTKEGWINGKCAEIKRTCNINRASVHKGNKRTRLNLNQTNRLDKIKGKISDNKKNTSNVQQIHQTTFKMRERNLHQKIQEDSKY